MLQTRDSFTPLFADCVPPHVGRPGRDETELLHALAKALNVLVHNGLPESALRESFVHAIAGLRAERGILAQVRSLPRLEVEVLCSKGLSSEDQAACQSLRSIPGVSATLIRQTIETGRTTLIENSQAEGSLSVTTTLRVRRYSILCAPVLDSLTRAPVAVLYFQNDAEWAFGEEDREWLTAYAAALGQALTLHTSTQRRFRELRAECERLKEGGGPEIIGDSEGTRRLLADLQTFLPSTARPDAPPILVLGESGTGKELVARYLHHYSSTRSRAPFQAFNCAGLRGELAEAKLFGHVRGAFTGAVADSKGLFRAADKGVLFLDEIGEMPPEGQALLLRVLENRTVQPLGDTREIPVDVQLVLATNRNLEEEVAAKRFREDLYYRIAGLCVTLAPLRDPSRIADIRPLLSFYLAKHERLLQKKTLGLTPAAFRHMLEYSWPGNVRQLNNACMCLVTHAAAGAPIGLEDIQAHRPEILSGPRNPNPEAYLEDDTATYGEAIVAFRRKLILERLRRHGSAAEAARSLQISEPTFYRHWSDARGIQQPRANGHASASASSPASVEAQTQPCLPGLEVDL